MDQYLELLKLSRPYRVILVTNALISTVLYPYLLYLFFTRTPKEISTCMRLNLFNATTTCYALSLMLALWQPVPVVPLLVYTLKYHYRWMGSHRKTALYYTVQTMIVISLMVILIHYMHNTPEEFGEMLNDLPSSEFKSLLSAVSQQESTFASYSYAKWTKGLGVVYIGFFTAIVASEVLIITVMIFKTAKEIQLTREIVRPSTHLVQMMIFRTFLLKSIFFLVFFLVPLSIIQLSLAGVYRSHCAGFVMYSLFSLHTPLIYLQLLCVIRPYRRFTWALLIRTFSFLRCVKYNGSFGGEHLDQMSDQTSQRRSSVIVMRIGSASIGESFRARLQIGLGENGVSTTPSPRMLDVLDFFTRNDLEKLQMTCAWINQLVKKHFKSKPLRILDNAKLELNLDSGMQMSLSKPTMHRRYPTICWDPSTREWLEIGARYVTFSKMLPFLDKTVRVPKVYILISDDTNLKQDSGLMPLILFVENRAQYSHSQTVFVFSEDKYTNVPLTTNRILELIRNKFMDSDTPPSFQVIFAIKIVGAKLSNGEMGEFCLQNNRTREVLQLRLATFDEVAKYCEFKAKVKYFMLERPQV
ncbi:hypothetical protein DdX_16487 [Ditylenchus destructor]|uniref:Uncharacterized protein n=1 Tax=Ditylenchus destructor TaxID=166010 RepID=A0AAD4MTF9_9BILA|nr:hypothetical protein DdX_16487 [Ditylenchus destructor]